MGKFRKGIGLVHKLGQLAAAEKLLDRGCYRPDIDQGLGSNDIHILDSHPLLDHPLHPGKTYPELVLKEFAYRTQSPVPQVVYIVNRSYIV